MARVRVKINSRGASALLKSAEVGADIQRRVEAVGSGAGSGYEADVRVGRTRQRGMVKTDTPEAMIDNARNATLLKNLDRGRS